MNMTWQESLASLNPEQKNAVMTTQGPLLILAGAGSGKTKTITHRMAHLIFDQKIAAHNILGVTFTNKAAQEMKERVQLLVGKSKGRTLWLSTFHALCQKILKEHIELLGYHGRFAIFDTSDQLTLIREALQQFRGGKNFDRKLFLPLISKLKNNFIGPHDFAQSNFFNPDNELHHAATHVYEYYQRKLQYFNALDFDDLLFLAVKLLDQHEDVRIKTSQKFKYIMVDEYQDTNAMQFKLLQLLTYTHHNICVVGDDDQSIYAFRGADVNLILNFAKYFPGAKTIKLEQNYRSTNPILDLANNVIAKNKKRHDKKLWSAQKEGKLPFLWSCQDQQHEAQVIAENILSLRNEGISYKSMAILCRSNGQFQELEQELKMQQIPYAVFGGQKFYEKKEIKDIIAFLNLVHNHFDDISFRRIVNVPPRGIGEQTLEKLSQIATKQKKSLYYMLSQLHHLEPELPGLGFKGLLDFYSLMESFSQIEKNFLLEDFITHIVKETKYVAYTISQYPHAKQAELKVKDLNFFIQSAKRFRERAQKYDRPHDLSAFLHQLMLQDSQDHENNDDSEKQQVTDEVSLMTYHASKGLEFDHVYLVGAEEELLPHKKSIEEGNDLSEELRLFYVGITRAKKTLTLTYCKEKVIYNKKVARLPTRFLQQLDCYYHFQDRTGFGHLTEDEARSFKANFFSDLSKMLD